MIGRASWIGRWLDSIRQDVGYASRSLRTQPGFAAVVVLVLGTVIGLHTTLATVIAGVILRPWPGVADPASVVRLFPIATSGRAGAFSMDDYRAIAERTRSLSGVVAMTGDEVKISDPSGDAGAARSVSALLVTGRFFDVLGVRMTAGRGFGDTDDRSGNPRAVVVLANAFWRARFAADPSVVGTTIRIDNVPFTIVGVTSAEFGFAEPAYGQSLFLPMASRSLFRAGESTSREPTSTARNLDIAGRLAPGTTRAQAVAELQLLLRELTLPADAQRILVTDTAFASHPSRSGATQPLVAGAILYAGLLLVWLTACANVGNLLLGRAAARVREIGIRLSLGASRGRVVRQLLTEGLLLAAGAVALGMVVAWQLPFIVLRVVGGAETSFPFKVTPDTSVLAYAVLLAGLSALVFALAPALHATRIDLAGALNLREGLPRRRFALRGVLLGVQVAMSVTLLVSAAVLLRGAQLHAGSFDPGFAVDGLTVVTFELPPDAYDDARRQALVADVTDSLRQNPLPGVEAFGFATWEPSFIRRGFHTPVQPAGEAADRSRDVAYMEVSPGYLDALGIPIVAGRDFTSNDPGRNVVVINETMARQYWPNQNPVGRTFVPGRGTPQEIIGVMRDAHTHSVYTVPPLFYQPLRGTRPMPKLIVRTRSAAAANELPRLVARLDPRVRIQAVPLSSVLDERLRETRTGPTLAAVLGAFALLLSTIGLSGVFAYAVRQRTREIGIRMALGAPPRAVVQLIVADHSLALAAGLGVGLAGAVASTLVMRSRLHGVGPFDPVSYTAVAVLLAAAGLAASYVPARRAIRVDPAVALRYE